MWRHSSHLQQQGDELEVGFSPMHRERGLCMTALEGNFQAPTLVLFLKDEETEAQRGRGL